MKEMLGGCCVCADENGWTDNPLIYCDGPSCEVAVHQGCYGIQEVPDGEWFCAKCSASSSTTVFPNGSTNGSHKNRPNSFRCELCPSSFGALKKTDKSGWAHVICALYIPEVRFGDVHSMEPVILSDVPTDRFDRNCYICENAGSRQQARSGACMSCNKNGCKRSFHVTCAQRKGLLCEEGGISKNVKYCGYCENHLRKAQHDPSIKVIPACPVTRLPPQQDLPTPPPSSNSSAHHMLVESLPPRPDKVNNLLRIGAGGGGSETPLQPITTTTTRAIVVSTATAGSLASTSAGATTTTTTTFASTATFSPPLTTSSRSSVALEPTPPLGVGGPSQLSQPSTSTMGGGGILLPPPPPPPVIPSSQPTSIPQQQQPNNHQPTNGISLVSHPLMAGANAETPVGAHLQQIQQQQSAAAAAASAANLPADHNGLYGVNYLATLQNPDFRLPAAMASYLQAGAEFHLNGAGDLEEKTVKAVLTAPLAKAKRMREKSEAMEKGNKRPRAASRPHPPPPQQQQQQQPQQQQQQQPIVNTVAFTGPTVAQQTPMNSAAKPQQSVPNSVPAMNGVAAAAAAAANATVAKSANMRRLVNMVGSVTSAESLADAQQKEKSADKRTTTSFSNGPGPSMMTSEAATNAKPSHTTMNGSIGSSRGHSTLPLSMEQLLERQFDQGTRLIISQAHFDVAQLLSCLHQLKTENIKLEEQLDMLTKRKEHLVALNNRLSQPLSQSSINSSQPSTSNSNQVTSPTRNSPLVPSSQTQTSAATVSGTTIVHPAASSTSNTIDELNQMRSLASSVGVGVGNNSSTTTTTIAQISRPVATHPSSSTAAAALMSTPTFQAVSTTSANRTTPSTAGQSLAATPIMSAATSNTTTNLTDFTNISPERLQQLSASTPMMNNIYRNQILSPALLNQLIMNPEYLSNPASLSNSMFSRILQQPQMVAAAAALVSNQQGSGATSNGN